jgi:hypothetical protein
MFVSRQNVENRQLVVFSFLPQKRIQDLNMCDLRLIHQNRIQKMNRDTGMLRTSQHQLECEIHQRADADCHVILTTHCLLPPSTARLDHIEPVSV